MLPLEVEAQQPAAATSDRSTIRRVYGAVLAVALLGTAFLASGVRQSDVAPTSSLQRSPSPTAALTITDPSPVQEAPPRPCCRGFTLECLACAAGQTEAEYCVEHARSHVCGFEELVPLQEAPPRMCCRAFTLECLACAAGQTESEYCAENAQAHVCEDSTAEVDHPAPEREIEPRMCCRAFTLECLACAAGQTQSEYCEENAHAHVCEDSTAEVNPPAPEREIEPRMCCRAFTLECLACAAGKTESEYCAENAHAHVCEDSTAEVDPPAPEREIEPRMCCQAFTVDCLACAAGQTEAEYCEENAQSHLCGFEEVVPVQDAPPRVSDTICCQAMTVSCLACSVGLTDDEYCDQYPDVNVCIEELQEMETMEMEEDEQAEEEGTMMCCEALTVSCLACAVGLTEEEYCAENPDFQDCVHPTEAPPATPARACCKALSVPCLACVEGVAEEEYCQNHPEWDVCRDSTAEQISHPCCMALTADCLACAEQLTVEEYCAMSPETEGCPGEVICCQAMTADCLACSDGVEVSEFCSVHPETDGCGPEDPEPRICCMAMNLNCLACAEGVTQSEYCVNHPEFEECAVTA